MKIIYTLLLVVFTTISFAQIEGTWMAAKQTGALAVGPTQGDGSWWTFPAADTSFRACYFDDSLNFNGGVFTHYMDNATFVEHWQHGTDFSGDGNVDAADDTCLAAVPPHDGIFDAPYSYTYNTGTGELTVYGIGAHVGLPKVHNGGELISPSGALAIDSIVYLITFTNNDNTMLVDIDFGGMGWWRFIYNRKGSVAAPNPNVTFRVDMSEYTGPITTGVYVNGTFNSWCGTCNPLVDVGNNIWETTVELPLGALQYKYTVDGWSDQELFDSTTVCVDPIDDGFYNRYLDVSVDTTLLAYCWSSCDVCEPSGLNELLSSSIGLKPNPAEDRIHLSSEYEMEEVFIMDISGNIIFKRLLMDYNVQLDISELSEGLYIVVIKTDIGEISKRFVKK